MWRWTSEQSDEVCSKSRSHVCRLDIEFLFRGRVFAHYRTETTSSDQGFRGLQRWAPRPNTNAAQVSYQDCSLSLWSSIFFPSLSSPSLVSLDFSTTSRSPSHKSVSVSYQTFEQSSRGSLRGVRLMELNASLHTKICRCELPRPTHTASPLGSQLTP